MCTLDKNSRSTHTEFLFAVSRQCNTWIWIQIDTVSNPEDAQFWGYIKKMMVIKCPVPHSAFPMIPCRTKTWEVWNEGGCRQAGVPELHRSKMQIVGTRDPQSEVYNSLMAVCQPLHRQHPFSIAAQKSNLWSTDKIKKLWRREHFFKKKTSFNLIHLALLCYNTLDNGR